MERSSKRYACRRCGCETTQDTNHYGPTHSSGHFNCCPACPPWAKYVEFGGFTIWDCLEDEAIPQYLRNLQDGERVIETGVCCTKGWVGTVYHNKDGLPCVKWDQQPNDTGQMSTSATWGTRRLYEQTKEKMGIEMKKYVIQMWEMVEPVLFGPFDTEDDRIACVVREGGQENSYCKLNINDDGTPSVYPFTNIEIEGD